MQLHVSAFIFLFSITSWSAPVPATSSSHLTAADKGLFYSKDGFHLGTNLSKWVLNSKDPEKQIHYSHQDSETASVMVRTNQLEISTNLEAYAKKWIKNYSSFGFDLLGAKTFSENNNRGMVVDLINKAKDKQVRQAIYVKEKRAVIITCTDDSKTFLATIPECNQLIRNFSWIESTPQTNF